MNKHKKLCKDCYFNDKNNKDYCEECWDCELITTPDGEQTPTNYVKYMPYDE